MVTDPIADLLIRLQNASRVGHERVVLPTSKIKTAIAAVLAKEGYVAEVEKPKKNTYLSLALAYKNGSPVIHGIKRLSKPSRRLYVGVGDIHPVKRGHGLLVLSTPSGVMTGGDARKHKVGGEALFEIW
jgi:small subunit ribosomal protein S8